MCVVQAQDGNLAKALEYAELVKDAPGESACAGGDIDAEVRRMVSAQAQLQGRIVG